MERNPVRAGLAARGEDWPWSSAAGHCGLRGDELAGDPCGLHRDVAPPQWSAWLAADWSEAELDRVNRIRCHTHTGRPAGDETFVDRLESLLGRVLRPKKAGRPRKKRK